MDVINIIREHSLTVRCLPYETVSYWSYREGDENLVYVDANGNKKKRNLEIVKQVFDLAYFESTPPPKWDKGLTPQQRLNRYLKANPTGIRTLLKETKTVEKGNVVKMKSGYYSTQDAQWKNKIYSIRDLYKYFLKEFIYV